jgi:hypothetical protein
MLTSIFLVMPMLRLTRRVYLERLGKKESFQFLEERKVSDVSPKYRVSDCRLSFLFSMSHLISKI